MAGGRLFLRLTGCLSVVFWVLINGTRTRSRYLMMLAVIGRFRGNSNPFRLRSGYQRGRRCPPGSASLWYRLENQRAIHL